MKPIWGFALLFLFLLGACQWSNSGLGTEEGALDDKKISLRDKSPILEEEAADTVSLKVKISEHSVQLSVSKETLKKPQLSADEVKRLETWWDSLPKPLQSQIKANEVEIELVSNLQTSDNKSADNDLTDNHIENTGATLERIIGSPTDMTFTVNTTFFGGMKNKASAQEELSTKISLVKKVPTKLAQFSTEIVLRDKEINNKNIQSLQYWWSSLPEDLRQKIQQREVTIELTCVAIDFDLDSKASAQVGELAEDFAFVFSDILHQMIGHQRIGKQNSPLAHLKSMGTIEKIQEANVHIDSPYFIRIQLKNNKAQILPGI